MAHADIVCPPPLGSGARQKTRRLRRMPTASHGPYYPALYGQPALVTARIRALARPSPRLGPGGSLKPKNTTIDTRITDNCQQAWLRSAPRRLAGWTGSEPRVLQMCRPSQRRGSTPAALDTTECYRHAVGGIVACPRPTKSLADLLDSFTRLRGSPHDASPDRRRGVLARGGADGHQDRGGVRPHNARAVRNASSPICVGLVGPKSACPRSGELAITSSPLQIRKASRSPTPGAIRAIGDFGTALPSLTPAAGAGPHARSRAGH
jgi:hypothetical protein